MTLAALAKENNTSRQYISQILKRESPKIDGMIIAILETLGYDIRIEYVKREATQCASDTSV
jgi:transcriptional regulator with XRE-family HTH domain